MRFVPVRILVCVLFLATRTPARDPLWTTAPFGTNAMSGTSVSTGPDVDGDGIGDVLLGAPGHGGGAGAECGAIALLSGATGDVLLSLEGEAAGDRFGEAVVLVDLNHDGLPEALVGAPQVDGPAGTNAGRVYTIDATNGAILRRLEGPTGGGVGEGFGHAIDAAGDLTFDGIDEILVGAYRHDGLAGEDSGRVTIHSGSTGLPLASWEGERAFDGFGYSIAGGASFDGNAVPDFVVGAPYHEGSTGRLSGKIYAISGSDRSELWNVEGDRTLGLFGWSVAVVGLVDGDSIDDVAAGAPDRDHDVLGLNVGRVGIFSGSTGNALLEVFGQANDERLGFSVAALGDLTGDGFAEVLAGSPGTSGPEGWGHGELVVIDGQSATRALSLVGSHRHDRLGAAVAGAADLDGDGRLDVVASAPGHDGAGFESGLVLAFSGDSCELNSGALGDGLAGKGGFIPIVEIVNCSCDPANPLLEITNGLGGALGLLWIGIASDDIPFFGGRFYIDLTAFWTAPSIVLGGSPGIGGGGSWNAPGIDFHGYEGLTLYLQATFLDGEAIEGVSLTNAVEMVVE